MIIITFQSTHDALEIEEALIDEEIDFIVMPTPKSISKSCGLTLKFKKADLVKVQKIVKAHDILNKQYFMESILDNQKVYTSVE